MVLLFPLSFGLKKCEGQSKNEGECGGWTSRSIAYSETMKQKY